MDPKEVTEKLQLNQLKDRIWFVVPSCATTGEGLFEGLVSVPGTVGGVLLTEVFQAWLSNNVKNLQQRQGK